MVLLAGVRRMGDPTQWCHRELTIAEMLSDSIVIAVMAADGVDPDELAATLRGFAQRLGADRSPPAS